MDQSSQTFLDRDITIHVADSALIHLMLAGMESYKVRHWGKNVTAKRGPAETAGLLFGYTTRKDSMDHVMVEHVSTDTFAKGTYQDVGFNQDVTNAKRDVIEERWPYLSLVGDFHTHPYKTFTDAQKVRGWEASTGDRKWWGRKPLGRCAGHIALILTITRLARRHENTPFDTKTIENNVIRWQQLDRYRFWLTAYAVDYDGDNPVVVSPGSGSDHPTRPHTYIDVPTINGTNVWFSYR